VAKVGSKISGRATHRLERMVGLALEPRHQGRYEQKTAPHLKSPILLWGRLACHRGAIPRPRGARLPLAVTEGLFPRAAGNVMEIGFGVGAMSASIATDDCTVNSPSSKPPRHVRNARIEGSAPPGGPSGPLITLCTWNGFSLETRPTRALELRGGGGGGGVV